MGNKFEKIDKLINSYKLLTEAINSETTINVNHDRSYSNTEIPISIEAFKMEDGRRRKYYISNPDVLRDHLIFVIDKNIKTILSWVVEEIKKDIFKEQIDIVKELERVVEETDEIANDNIN